MTEIHGVCDDRFDAVRRAFVANFTKRRDVGASVAVTFEGEVVVDLWGGHRNAAATEPWTEDTIVNVYSTTKTLTALCAVVLADRGEIDFRAPVKKYWPEFAQNGKDGIEIRHLLSHTAGLSGMDEPFTGAALYDWDAVVAALARQAPWWEPGTRSGYHAITQGHLVGEVVRRVSGQSLGTFFRREIADPLDVDFHIGTGDVHFARIGELIPPPATPLDGRPPDSIGFRTLSNPAVDVLESRTAGWRCAEIPAANGHGNARSIARALTVLANGGAAFGTTLLSEAGCRVVLEEQIDGIDLVLGIPIRFGMGFGLKSSSFPIARNDRTGYWGGWGGSLAVVDLEKRLCVVYVMNRMEASIHGDARGFTLLEAAYEGLA